MPDISEYLSLGSSLDGKNPLAPSILFCVENEKMIVKKITIGVEVKSKIMKIRLELGLKRFLKLCYFIGKKVENF